jgi:RNA 2',3'-cyclic 3'-phosphodiesterase
MPRLFVALDPPAPVRDALAALRAEVPGARWLTPEQMHLTLAFIGEVDEASAQAIETALAGVRASSVEAALTELGAFPNRRAPRVLVASVAETPALLDLQARVARALGAAGVGLEMRPFRPHLTLARLKYPDRRSVDGFLDQPIPSLPFPAEAFHLYASSPTPGGSRYRRLRSYDLPGVPA